MRFFIGMFCLVWSLSAWSWNAVGHRVIAQIAYDHCTAHTKHMLYRYHRAFNRTQRYHDGFVASAVWLDRISHQKKYISWQPMHYIDLAFTDDHSVLPKYQKVNAVGAIHHASALLKNGQVSDVQKGVALRILLHVIGDVHQPLHAATRVSKKWPDGDRGGNLVLLKNNPAAHNLHAYWDGGAGLWCCKKHYSAREIKVVARALEKTYPCRPDAHDNSPMAWAQESHQMAVRYAYRARPDHASYQIVAQKISQQRVAQAGCRLASWLNKLEK